MSSVCNSAQTLCLSVQQNTNQTSVTIHAKVQGANSWAAFGVGEKMINSPLFVFWKNSKGECVVSERIASGYELPQFSNNQLSEIISPDVKVKSSVQNPNLVCTISRPAGQRPAIAGNLIYALGQGVKDAEDPKSSFGEHTDAGKFVLKTNDATSTIASLGFALLFLL